MKDFMQATESRHHLGLRSGMTLVEILAVVVILGLLAGTLLMGFSGSFGKAKHELAKTAIGQIPAEAFRKPRVDLG